MTTACLLPILCVFADATTQPVTPRVEDRLRLVPVDAVTVKGFLGERIDANVAGRLKHIPMDELLAGFRQRPGAQAWCGEHVGKWLHAATLAWQYTGDAALRKMLDAAVRDLIATQQPDGYLGTYLDKDRWTSWDVWVHKYDLIGLLAYHDATHDAEALAAARRIGDLLCATFGPGKRDIIASGTHVGMAATSVLEPMVKLYRDTGDERYLAFCKYLVESWDQPNGPKIIASLLEHGKVNRTANRKAYEMMSNLVGLCELYRVTGDERYLRTAVAAWDDIAANQLYITGGTSLGEHFQPDGHLPDVGAVAETCANVTWMQLSVQLLALTGEPKYADAIEQLVFNHLLAAQAADGSDWCYFTPLKGRKPFRKDVNCCHSSGPRGVAMIPGVFYGARPGAVRVNLYGESRGDADVPGVGLVYVKQHTSYPANGVVQLEIEPRKPARFALELRVPGWSKVLELNVNGDAVAPGDKPLAGIDREWQPGDKVRLVLDVAPKWIPGTGEHEGFTAARKGPFLLCASSMWDSPPVGTFGIAKDASFIDAPQSEDPQFKRMWGFDPAYVVRATAKGGSSQDAKDLPVALIPFAVANDALIMVWLPRPDRLPSASMSLLIGGAEHYSRKGNVEGSIADGDPTTYRVTYDGKKQGLDTWEVEFKNDRHVAVNRIVFHHGRTLHDGGWFDTSQGKPEVFIQEPKDGKPQWTKVGTLESYPTTDATTPPAIKDGQAFELRIPKPSMIFGVRVVGRPASGDNPEQAFSSCGEIAAYGH